MNTPLKPHVWYAADLERERYQYTRNAAEVEALLFELDHPSRLSGAFRAVLFVRDADGNLVDAYGAHQPDIRPSTRVYDLLEEAR